MQQDYRFGRSSLLIIAGAIPIAGFSYFLGFGFSLSAALFFSFAFGAGLIFRFSVRSRYKDHKKQIVTNQAATNSGVAELMARSQREAKITPIRSSQTPPDDLLEIGKSQQAFKDTPEGVLPALVISHPSASDGTAITNTNWNIKDKKANTPVLEPIDFDLRTAIEETVDRFVTQAKGRGVELTCLLSCDVPTPFRGDPGHLRQIIVNLIENALTSIEQGEVIVHVTLICQTPTHATFRFSVSYMESDLPLGFTQTSEAKLINSRDLVESMGGKLETENSLGQGSTTWFILTFEKQPPKALPAPPPRSTLRGVRVLMVGDISSILLDQLAGWGTIIHSAKDSSHALRMVNATITANQAYDVVVLVCQKLELASLELASAIRIIPSLPSPRLVLVSDTGEKGDARRIRQAGIEAYLTQPVSQSLLFECLATVLSQPLKGPASSTPLITRYTLAEAKARKRLRILVVDSNLADQKYAVRLLDELGYRADVAINGQEVIEAHSRVLYAAVLIACKTSQLDEFATRDQIRQLDGQEGIYTPIIGIVEADLAENFSEQAQTRMDDLLAKPFDLGHLRTTLDRCIARAKDAAAKSLLASPTLQSSAEFDLREALARVDGDKELFNEIVELFLEEYPKSLANIREALSQHDIQSVAYTANALRGALGNFAAAKAIDATLRLEQMGRQGDLSQAQEVITSLEDILFRLKSALTNLNLQLAA